MNVYVLAIIVGLAAFLFIIALAFLIFLLVRNRRKDKLGLLPGLERVEAPIAKDEVFVRRTLDTTPKSGPEAKGRFYAFGALIAIFFGTLAVRLWTLQILSHDEYVGLADKNMTSNISVPAIRGRILDRNGVELITNRPSIVLTGKRSLANDRGLVHRLSLLLGIPRGVVRRNILNDTVGMQADRTIASDVPMRSVAFIKEHPTLFEGVSIENRTVRYYPNGNLAAHLLGYTGPVTQDTLNEQEASETFQYESGDIVGKDGAEYEFEQILRGMRGRKTYLIDSSGAPLELIDELKPMYGSDVCLTIDANLQRNTDRILYETILAAHERGHVKANGGALLCIDVKEGGILAASSYPTYNPSDLAGGISIDLWEQLMNIASNYPLTNRVISGLYPAASTFKAFTSMAGLAHGVIGPYTQFYCNGYWNEYGDQWGQRCWIHPYGHGNMGLEEAINQSCDLFFYNVADGFFKPWFAVWNALPYDEKARAAEHDVLQDSLKSWGFHAPTGIDLPGEASGRIPNFLWKQRAFVDTPEDATWNPGDMTSMCIGQGDMLVTPLQLANGYATIARGSAIKPHIFHKVVNKEGETIITHRPTPSDVQPQYDQVHLNRVIDGLKRVIVREKIFNPIPVVLAGKSGTAEVANKDEYAWFVAYGPVNDPQYCVACVIEEGGGGSASAIVGVLHTFAAIYGVDVGVIVAGEDTGER
ncbi:MAG: penicillin-binding protein 2 [Coriobacteriia bacterium]|nr:penicillin-binding protein 2 [Coriobacteriia bacterium]